jgi:hypothetical protein
MKKATTSVATVVLVFAAFAFTSAGAAAETFHIRPAGEIEWSGRLRATAGFEVTCNVRLVGTIAESAEARTGARIGSARSLAVRECSSGTTVRTLAVFPLPIVIESWLVTERTLVGLLVRVEGIGILIEYPPLLARCLYNFTAAILIRINRDGSTETSIMLERPLVLVRNLSVFCPLEIPVERSEGTLSPRQTVELV